MKAINNIFILLFFITVIFSCGTEQENEVVSDVVNIENLVVADYAIEGMVCAMGCAGTIQKDVASLSGVVISSVDYEAGKAHFEYDESVVSEKEIIAKIESIAEGQYMVGEWTEKKVSEEDVEIEDGEESGESEETITEVSLPSFEIPNLFTLLMDQI